MKDLLNKTTVYELVYDATAFNAIKERWPQAVQKDARDMMHPDRILVKIPDVTYEDFYRHALDEGYCRCCLTFERNLLDSKAENPEFHKLVSDWLAKQKETEKCLTN